MNSILTRERKKELDERPAPVRVRLPEERLAITHTFDVGGLEGSIRVGMFEDGTPGEIFIEISKEGSTVSGFINTIATLVSRDLQNGVPLKELVSKFAYVKFEPSGRTKHPCIPEATSVTDYMFRWLGLMFLTPEEMREIGVETKCDGCEQAGFCKIKSLRPTVILVDEPARLM